MRRTPLSTKGRKRLLRDLRLLFGSESSGLPSSLDDVKGLLARKKMRPGDIMLLPDSEALNSPWKRDFFAVLACPSCGTPGLITGQQYFGAVPVTCASEACSYRFRIDYQRRFVHLPNS